MGARVARMFRNFNLENRVFREISKEKPITAPRHPTLVRQNTGGSDVSDSVKQKDESLQVLLRSVYVESKDPAAASAEASKEVTVEEAGRRALKVSFPVNMFGLAELTDVPKGKLTITEALKALGSHHHQPQVWTSDKIAQEYSLDLKDTKAVLDFFIPFKVEIIPPKTKPAKRIKAS